MSSRSACRYLRRIIELAKAEKLTSVADFLAARYGKNSTVATIVALISLVGTIPYIALQLKAISSTVTAMVNPSDYGIGSGNLYFLDLPLVATLVLACFAIMFGTRHTDATEHQDGLILAVSMELLVKLVAFLTAGVCVIWFLFDGPVDLWQKSAGNELVNSALNYETPISRWITLTLLSACAIIMLPRQFHVTVVENRSAKQLRLAGYLFPLYLVAINLFVLPVAIAGLLTFGGAGNADLYVLSLPLAGQMPVVSLITFIGGFSAATAMVIVDSVALSIMVSNDIIMPIFLRRKLAGRTSQRDDFAKSLLNIRRSAIFAVLLLGYAYYRSTDSTAGLASIGLLSFAAIAQIAPALFGGLVWRRANARGAVLGLTSGFIIWFYLLFLPSLGGPDYSYVASCVPQLHLSRDDAFCVGGRRSSRQRHGDEPARQHRLLHCRLNDAQCTAAGAHPGGDLRQGAITLTICNPRLEDAYQRRRSENGNSALSRRGAHAAIACDIRAGVGPEAGGRSAGGYGAHSLYRTAAGKRHRLLLGAAGAFADPAEDRGCVSRHRMAARPGQRGAAV